MHPIASNREALLRIVQGTTSALQRLDPSELEIPGVPTANVQSREEVERRRDTVVFALENSARTLRLHADLAAISRAVAAGVERELPFIPEDQMLSLMQSAIEEYMPEESVATATPFDTSDLGWLKVAW